MSNSQKSLNKLIDSLDERVKELNCLYEVEELLRESDLDIKEMYRIQSLVRFQCIMPKSGLTLMLVLF